MTDLPGAWPLLRDETRDHGSAASRPRAGIDRDATPDPERISPEEIDAHLRETLAESLLFRARFIVGFLALTCVFFLGIRFLAGGHVHWLAQAVRAGNFVVLLTMFLPLRGPRAADASVPVVLLASVLSLACSALVCTIEHDPINAGVAVGMLTVSTAAFMPWSWRHQLTLTVLGGSVLLANQLALGAYARTVESITATSALLAILATVAVACTLEKARRRGAVNELRRYRAEARLREANGALEQRVLDRTVELREAMQELQAFTYSVSHDLRSPLRHINGMSELLEDEYASGLDETASAYLGRLKRAAGRMGQLIDALLARSRVGQAEMRPEMLDLCALADAAIEDCRAGERGRNVEWVPPPRLMVRADRTLMAVVLQHLVGNAWKFTRPRKHARIELGELCIGGRREIYVRDNGVGFPMDHAGKLFENFQRLHGEDYEGTGIGLATVARIVARHGGAVRLQSEPDKGTTVYFTLGDSSGDAA